MNGKQTDEPVSGAAPTGGGMTRRDILAASWVAPVILTVPLGAVISQRAQAQAHNTSTHQRTNTGNPPRRTTLAPTKAHHTSTHQRTHHRQPTKRTHGRH